MARSWAVVVVVGLLTTLLLLSATAQARITQEDIDRISAATGRASGELLSVVSASGLESAEGRAAFQQFARKMDAMVGEVDDLDAEGPIDTRYQEVLTEGYRDLARDARAMAGGVIDFNEWRRRSLAQSDETQAQIERIAADAQAAEAIEEIIQEAIAPSNDEAWWEWLISQWWFWAFGPELLITALWLISLPFIGGWAGVAAWRESRRT
jgi:hypothetical protein